MGRFGSIVGSALISADRRIFMRNEEKNHTEKVSVTEVTHEAADLFWSQGLKLQHHDNHFFEGFMMDKTPTSSWISMRKVVKVLFVVTEI